MSYAAIDHHHENIYNLAQPDEINPPKAPRYQSQFAKNVRDEYKKDRLAHHTMGEAETHLAPPEKYLRKKARDDQFYKRVKSARAHREKVPVDQAERKPTVPKVTDHIATPMRTRRSFVHKNALEAMVSEPTALDNPQFVDAPQGNKQSLKQSGMVPTFTEKKDFGKVPTYIKKLKKSKLEDEKRWEHEQQEIIRRREMMKLQDQERDAILQGLRTNWSELHHLYQGLSLLTDTLPKKNRREKIESQLDELEKFIELLDKHPVIIITDNPYMF